MCFTTYFTQKQIMKRSGPVEGQAAMMQKFLLYVMPLSLFVTGFFFPIGVLLYWFTNNLWTLGQQFFVLKTMPPGSSGAPSTAVGDAPGAEREARAPRPRAKPVRTTIGAGGVGAASSAGPDEDPRRRSGSTEDASVTAALAVHTDQEHSDGRQTRSAQPTAGTSADPSSTQARRRPGSRSGSAKSRKKGQQQARRRRR